MIAIKDYTEDEIRREAYQIYLRRSRLGIPGDQKSDWYEAEIRVQQRYERGFGRE
jgi:hypothetical protein